MDARISQSSNFRMSLIEFLKRSASGRSGKLRLEFATRPNFANILLNACLLLVALVCCVYLLSRYTDLSVERDMRLAKSQRDARLAMRSTETSQTKAQLISEVSAANKAARHITLPWGRLLDALESASYQPAPLLQVHPDSENRALAVVGETSNFIELDTYLTRLRKEPMFRSVYLVDYEMLQSEIPRPLRFTIRATW
jgi:hypothetical protein